MRKAIIAVAIAIAGFCGSIAPAGAANPGSWWVDGAPGFSWHVYVDNNNHVVANKYTAGANGVFVGTGVNDWVPSWQGATAVGVTVHHKTSTTPAYITVYDDAGTIPGWPFVDSCGGVIQNAYGALGNQSGSKYTNWTTNAAGLVCSFRQLGVRFRAFGATDFTIDPPGGPHSAVRIALQ